MDFAGAFCFPILETRLSLYHHTIIPPRAISKKKSKRYGGVRHVLDNRKYCSHVINRAGRHYAPKGWECGVGMSFMLVDKATLPQR